MTQVRVVPGNIAQAQVDALLLLTTGGDLLGQVDFAVMRQVGPRFHDQVLLESHFPDKRVICADDTNGDSPFKHILFVVDKWVSPLDELVLAGLEAAEQRRLTTVALPLLRTGVARHVLEDTPGKAANALITGIRSFLATKPAHVQQIHIVVWKNPAMQEHLRGPLAQL